MRGLIGLWCALCFSGTVWGQTDAKDLLREARQLGQAGQHADAIPLYERLTAEVGKQLGEDSWTLVYLLGELAVQHHALGATADAEPLYRRSLEIAETHDAGLDASLIPSLRGLAALAAGRGDLSDADTLYRRALKIQQHQEADDPGLARMLAELGLVSQLRNRLQEAEDLYRRALSVAEATGLAEVELATIANNLGALSSGQGRLEEAEPYYQRALEIRERVLGPEHPEVGLVLLELANLYSRQGRFAESIPLVQRNLKIREQRQADPVALSELHSQLAATYRQMDRLADAETHFKRAMELVEENLGPEHPTLALRGNNLAVLYSDQGRYTEAEVLYERAMEIEEKAFGANHVSVAVGLVNLASLHQKQGRLETARREAEMAKSTIDAQCKGREGSDFCQSTLAIYRDLVDRIETSQQRGPTQAQTVASTEQPPASAIVEPVTTPAEPPAEGGSKPSKVIPPSPSPASPQPTVAARKPPAGDQIHRAQVASRRERQAAVDVLDALRAAHPEQLASLAARVVRADLGERGVWHRVQLGEYTSASQAQALCRKLTQLGHDGCWVIATGG